MNNYQLSIKKYPSYKDSEVEWLGDVPEHWKCGMLNGIAKRVVVGIAEATTHAYAETGTPILRSTNIRAGRIIGDIFYINSDFSNERKSKLIKAGDLVTVRTGNVGVTAIIPKELDKCQCFTMLVTSLTNLASANYYCYWMNSVSAQGYFYLAGWGTAQVNISVPILQALPIPIPPLPEQKTIAHYLDTQTAQSDRKIDLLTQKATLYRNLKQSLINETVTRGLDKTVPMKDSAIEWIGEIPEHWQTRRINDIAVQSKTKNTGLAEDNLLSLSYGRIKRRDIDTSFGLLPESFETYQIIESGNIILRLTDLQNDQRSLRVGLAKERGIITSAYLCLKILRTVHPNFAYYLLFIYDISKVFYWFGGGLRQSMKFDDVKVFPFILPPLCEQKAIADYLDTKTAQIDQIIQTINIQIEKLKELRKTLINAVVTGKIKVV